MEKCPKIRITQSEWGLETFRLRHGTAGAHHFPGFSMNFVRFLAQSSAVF